MPEHIGEDIGYDEEVVARIKEAVETEEHFWCVFVLYEVDQAILTAPEEAEINLSKDDIIGVPKVGCMVCELVMEPSLVGGKCSGDPLIIRGAGIKAE